MTDWKMVARAIGLTLEDAELSRTVAPLEALEPAFARLVTTVAADMEPAIVFEAAAGEPSE